MTKQKKTDFFFFSPCYQAKNPHALLIVETYKYFLNEEVVEEKILIEETLACGYFIAMYIHGVMLLCESNPKDIGNLLEVLNDEHGKHKLLKCRKNTSTTCCKNCPVSKSKLSSMPKNWNGKLELG